MTTTTYELKKYYQDLLIAQYLNLPKARATIGMLAGAAIIPQTSVQVVTLGAAPSSGSFIFSYDGIDSSAINWNDANATIQTKLRAIAGLEDVVVAGELATQSLTITFTGVSAPAFPLVVKSNTLGTTVTIVETDMTLPLAVQDAFNILAGTTLATGVQLDTIAKYVGVTRTGRGFDSNVNITLNDTDFLTLIRMGIIKNSSGSSLAEIQSFINQFFPGDMFVFDSKQMFLTFQIGAGLGSNDLIQMFITQGLLPVPMAVGYAVIYGPTSEYFSFRTYQHALALGYPFNTYSNYNTTWTWMSYKHSVIPQA